MKYFAFILFILGIFCPAQTVYKTPSGKKYHLFNCKMVENTSSSLNIIEATKIGLEPCKICNPPLPRNIYGIASVPSKKTNGINKGNQCLGITKKGTRCKHYTKIGNDYCYQHNPDQ